MTGKQVEVAFELAESWVNGNRSHVLEILESMPVIVAMATAFQISSALPKGTDTDFENAIDNRADEHAYWIDWGGKK